MVPSKTTCSHCGLLYKHSGVLLGKKHFCCHGCKTVYEMLHEEGGQDNTTDATPIANSQPSQGGAFAHLDEKNIKKKVLDFELPQLARVRLHVPGIHCPACMEILEGLNKSNRGIVGVRVHFVKKTVTIDFNPHRITLSQVAELLDSIGYKPTINLDSTLTSDKRQQLDQDTIRLAIAGFCFGNIMLFSFPEYLGMENTGSSLSYLFSYFNILLAIPVLLYSAKDYFITTYKGLLQKTISVDLPIVIGLVTLFLRSLYDILLQGAPGYMDSLTGLVFFLLIGKWFQSKTYENLSFDRDYRSYFPLAVYKNIGHTWKPTLVYELEKGDCIRVRNQEIVPADSLLLDAYAYIDYSFVTGESIPRFVKKGKLIYAGGRLTGKPAEMQVDKKTAQSHLTGLWNNKLFDKSEDGYYKTFINKIAKNFTAVILLLALSSVVYWYFADPSKIWLTATAVLIVACPCALALAAPFTYGSTLRVFGRNGCYLKNADVVEKMANIDAVVFDKTGTLTQRVANIRQVGTMNEKELMMAKTLASSSTHPLSVLVATYITTKSSYTLTSYEEHPGKGIEGTIEGVTVKMGSASFVGTKQAHLGTHTEVHVSIGGKVCGNFIMISSLREGIQELLDKLGEKVAALLSGDSKADADRMRSIFRPGTPMHFNQTPQDKLQYISQLQKKRKKVMMVGDGLNDSGALKKSDVGIALADSTGVFTPACDGLLSGHKIMLLNRFLTLSKSALSILKISLFISFLYNAIGIFFAITGSLTPLTAAILMPVSSISVVIFTTLAVKIRAKKMRL